MTVRDGTFSAPYPLLGTAYDDQLTQLRTNSLETSPIVNGSILDIDALDDLRRALAGLYLGEYAFKSRYRWFYDKDLQTLALERNTGTEVSPVWATVINVSSTGNITSLSPGTLLFGVPVAVGSANAAGSSSFFSRSDHVHADRVRQHTHIDTLNQVALTATVELVQPEMTGIAVPGADGVKDYMMSVYMPHIMAVTSSHSVRIRLGTAGTIADAIFATGPHLSIVAPNGFPYTMGPFRLVNPPINSKITVSTITTVAGDVNNFVSAGAILDIREI
jgi:hypothetical protein